MTRMKDSGIDWIGQIPEEWEMNKFKYLFNTSKGLSITKDCLTEKGIPVINYGQIHSSLTKQVQSFDTRLPFINDSYLSNKNAQLNKGDFIFADTSEDLEGAGNFSTRLDSLGYFLAGYHTIIVRLKNNENHDFRYFMHLFDSIANRKQIQNKVSGVKVFSVTQGILNNIFVVIPPKTEQTKIADFLDKKTAQLDKVKALLEEQIQKLRDYRASLIYETVTKGLDKTVPMKDSGIDWIGQVPQGWGVNRLKYLANKIGSGKTPLGGSEIFEETGILFIRSQNIYNGLILLEDKATYINRNIHQQMIGTCVKKNDILLNITGASIGRVAKYDLDIEANVNQHVCIIRSNRYVLPDYLMYFIMSEFGQFMIKTHQISGNREGLSFENIGNFKIIAPGLDYQYEISQYLNKKMLTINQMIKTKEQQIANINKQRQTLIYDYVTGKKRV